MEDQIPNNIFITDSWMKDMQAMVRLRDEFMAKFSDVSPNQPSTYIALDFMGMPESVLGGAAMRFKPIYSDDLPLQIKTEFESLLTKYLKPEKF